MGREFSTSFNNAFGGLMDGPTTSIITPNSGLINTSGIEVNFSGLGFGETQGTGRIYLDNELITDYSTWNDSNIICIFPLKTHTGLFNLTIYDTFGNSETIINGFTYYNVVVLDKQYISNYVLDKKRKLFFWP